jgi:hypothetical protein
MEHWTLQDHQIPQNQRQLLWQPRLQQSLVAPLSRSLLAGPLGCPYLHPCHRPLDKQRRSIHPSNWTSTNEPCKEHKLRDVKISNQNFVCAGALKRTIIKVLHFIIMQKLRAQKAHLPSSPDDAKIVPVTFQQTRQTALPSPWSLKWPANLT